MNRRRFLESSSEKGHSHHLGTNPLSVFRTTEDPDIQLTPQKVKITMAIDSKLIGAAKCVCPVPAGLSAEY